MRWRIRWGLVVVLPLLIQSVACGSAPKPSGDQNSHLRGTLTVLAAASLTAAFTAEGSAFERLHAGLQVRFDFAGSSTLVTQVEQGARADVFASADEINMQHLATAGLVSGVPKVFARNRLEIVVGPGNPKKIESLSDLDRAGIIYISAAPGVPAGTYAAKILAAAHVAATPRSQEADVKAVVTKVQLGEADAGIVYVTDVSAAGRAVSGVPIPASQNLIANYPLATIKGAPNPLAASAFDHFILSPAGQRIMEKFGFAPV